MKPGIGQSSMEIKHENVTAPSQIAAMDLAIMPETPEGYKYLLVYQDYHSKFIELLPLKEKTPEAVVEMLVSEIFTCSEITVFHHSDQGNQFDSALIHELCDLWGITKTRTCAYTPRNNGMVE